MKKRHFAKCSKPMLAGILTLCLLAGICSGPWSALTGHAQELQTPTQESADIPQEPSAEDETLSSGTDGKIPEESSQTSPESDTTDTTTQKDDTTSSDVTPDDPSVVSKDQTADTITTKQSPKSSPKKAAKTVDDPIPDKTPRLVYGDSNLPDSDAFVLLVFGDGFTADQQAKFFEEAKNTADYLMETSPWDEFKDTIKIYALGVVSNESGARADKAINQEQADKDTRDTYFGSSYWSGGMQRLLTISSEGSKKAKELTNTYLPAADFNVIIVNAETYGGSGGNTCVASLNSESLEMMLHELGHTTAKLADEYFAGASYAREQPNMTAESDPEKVRWSRFIGKNGVGVYEYDNGGDGWYRPHENCKMRFLGKQYAFCEVCKEQIRKTFCQDSNVTKMFFQPYADTFYEADQGTDMKEYFIIRKGNNETTGDQLGSALTLEYFNSDGTPVNGIPNKAGDYKVTATFAGDGTYDECSQTASYTIELPDRITLDVASKIYDGKPAELDYKVDYDKEYAVKAHYTGTIPYAAEITYDYDSDEAPIKPGRYTVTLTAYDKVTDKAISKKSKDYEIKFKSTALSNNDTNAYPGAMPYYNNKTIVFTGEGYTSDEQGEFEALAKEYRSYFKNAEPFKEADLYMNYHSVEAVSEESGIGRTAKDTYFKLSYDENGKIIPGADSTDGAMYIGNNVITSYYKATIVIVNDKNVKKGTTVTNKRFTVYTTPDKAGMKFAANELLNYFTSQPEGYEASTAQEKDAQRTEFLKALYYTWYGSDYAPILSRAYNETFVENGTAYDLAPYFHTYILGKETKDVSYNMTYYADDNGAPGTQLDSAPSKAGTYHAKAELVLDSGSRYKKVTLDGTTYNLPLARGWTIYTISPKEPEVTPDPSDPTNPSDPSIEDPEDESYDEEESSYEESDENSKSKKSKVKTSDESPFMLYVGLMAVSFLAIGSVIMLKKKRRI